MSWLKVRNEASGDTVLGRVRPCSSFSCRLRGLTFRRRLDDDEGLLLIGHRESRVDAAIHMFFVFFPIAVVWLDAAGWVVDAEVARPFRPLYIPSAPAKDVLEGPAGLLGRVRVGHQLRFEEAPHG